MRHTGSPDVDALASSTMPDGERRERASRLSKQSSAARTFGVASRAGSFIDHVFGEHGRYLNVNAFPHDLDINSPSAMLRHLIQEQACMRSEHARQIAELARRVDAATLVHQAGAPRASEHALYGNRPPSMPPLASVPELQWSASELASEGTTAAGGEERESAVRVYLAGEASQPPPPPPPADRI